MDIGKLCSMEGCGILDYLPFKCNYCNKYHCLIHKDYESHNCLDVPQKKIYICKMKKCKLISKDRCVFCRKKFCNNHLNKTNHLCINKHNKLNEKNL